MVEFNDAQGMPAVAEIRKFAALDGWDIQRRYVSFAASDPTRDREFRRDFTMEILSYCTVIKAKGNEIPLSTDALIDNHLGSWQNVELLFKAVLSENGIDPETHANRTNHWAEAGSEMAIAFIAHCSTLIGPAFEAVGNVHKE